MLKCWGLSGAEVCNSCRSRQELSNAYLKNIYLQNSGSIQPRTSHSKLRGNWTPSLIRLVGWTASRNRCRTARRRYRSGLWSLGGPRRDCGAGPPMAFRLPRKLACKKKEFAEYNCKQGNNCCIWTKYEYSAYIKCREACLNVVKRETYPFQSWQLTNIR